MATVNKDFKIKSGLIVEGTNGTINGFNILTESQDSVDFIIDVIGGETLITSVESTQLEVVDGELNVKSGVFDAAGAADAAETAANSYTDGRETAITTAYQAYADSAAADAEGDANNYTDNREIAITSAYQSYADTAEADAVTTANAYTDGRETAITTAYQQYADTAEQDAKNYADALINDASSSSSEVWSAYKTSTEISLAQTAAELHADNAIAALVDSAPATLDTLNELAAALQDNPDIITDLQNIASGKQNTLTAGDNISIAADIISVTGLDSTDISDFSTAAQSANSGLWDTAGAASTAETNANSYTDSEITTALSTAQGYADQAELDAIASAGSYTDGQISALDTDDIEEGSINQYFTDTRAKIAAADLLVNSTQENISITGTYMGLTITAENGVADSDTDDLAEGSNNLYFTDERAIDAVSGADIYPNTVVLNNVSKQVATQITAETAGIQIGNYFSKSEYRSAEFLVKVAYGTHTEVSKVLLTLDTSDNIAITEYGIVGTNGSASTISADVTGDSVRLLVTTTNNNSTITVVGTLLI